jgi:hypothetical protein
MGEPCRLTSRSTPSGRRNPSRYRRLVSKSLIVDDANRYDSYPPPIAPFESLRYFCTGTLTVYVLSLTDGLGWCAQGCVVCASEASSAISVTLSAHAPLARTSSVSLSASSQVRGDAYVTLCHVTSSQGRRLRHAVWSQVSPAALLGLNP